MNTKNLISLDQYLVLHQMAPTIAHATRMIELGQVSVNGQVTPDPTYLIKKQAGVYIGADKRIYISIEINYLEKALHDFQLNITGTSILHIGTHLGDLVSYALQHHALQVVYIYMGDILPEHYATVPGVMVPEKTGLQTLTPNQVPVGVFDFILVDIPLEQQEVVFPYLKKFLKKTGSVITVLQPAPNKVERRTYPYGIIKTEKLKLEAIVRIQQHILNHGFYIEQVTGADTEGSEKSEPYLVLLKSGA